MRRLGCVWAVLVAAWALAGNTALESRERLEVDRYDWYARHERIVKSVGELDPQIVLLGDSTIHFWGSETDGAKCYGRESWEGLFGKYRVLNAGFGWDRIQNVRWRVEQGEVRGADPKLIILHIGTNNSSGTKNARQNTPEETAEGIYALSMELAERFPRAQLIVFDIFPREGAKSARRAWVNATNRALASYVWPKQVTRLSAEKVLTEPNGELLKGGFVDSVHPSAKGYAALAALLKPYVEAALQCQP